MAHLITLGSPHEGAAKAYPYWEAPFLVLYRLLPTERTIYPVILKYLGNRLDPIDAHRALTAFRAWTPSLLQVMPSAGYVDGGQSEAGYLYDESNDDSLKPEVDMVHRNEYLATLNSDLDTLFARTAVSTFVGGSVKTPVRFYVDDRWSWEWPYWDDGRPNWSRETPDFLSSYGDGTVWAASGQLAPPAHVETFTGVDHASLPGDGDVIDKIFSALGIPTPPGRAEALRPEQTGTGLIILALDGPAEATVTDPLGRTVGPGDVTIPNAEYVSDPSDPYKLIVIPDPEEGAFQITLSGYFSGTYELALLDTVGSVPTVVTDVMALWDASVSQIRPATMVTYALTHTLETSATRSLLAVTPVIKVPVWAGSSAVSGRAWPGGTVAIRDGDPDTLLGTGSVGDDGRFTVALSMPLKLDQEIYPWSDGVAGVPVMAQAHRTYVPLVVRNADSTPANQPPNRPTAPLPADGAADQPVVLALAWTGGDPDGDAVTYDVYLEAGDAAPDTLVCEGLTGATCSAGTLLTTTHYSWQVVATDEQGAMTEGPVWEFTTAALACVEGITNGGFEFEGDWEMPVTAYPARYTTAVAHRGERSMRVGIVDPAANKYSYSSARQGVEIPDGAGSARLRFWLLARSEESGDPPPVPNPLVSSPQKARLSSDAQYVLVLDENDDWIDTLLWQRRDDADWIPHEVDLLDYAGRSIKLHFGVYNDGQGGATGMYVDDVSLAVCLPEPANRPPYVPSDPSPEEGATGQPLTLTLSWSGGDSDGDAVTYDVYLDAGGSPSGTLVCEESGDAQCDPGLLVSDTDYSWQVVAEDTHGLTATGPVWAFATGGDHAPLLAAFDFGPQSVDVGGSPQPVTFTLHITDDLTGFDSGLLHIQSPSGSQEESTSFSGSERVSGDALDGVYEVVLTIPQEGEAGTWQLDILNLRDSMGNSRSYDTAALTTLGFPTDISVTALP